MRTTLRRGRYVIAGLAALALIVSACASDAAPDPDADAATGSTAAADTPDLDAARDYRSAREPESVSDPVAISISTIEVDGPLTRTGIDDDRELEVPEFGDISWYEDGTAPGAPGPAAILGHVDTRDGPDVFHRLHELEPGDTVVVDTEDGESLEFVIDRVEQHAKDEFPTEKVWLPSAEPRLQLITCGGEFDRDADSYRDNIIAFATPS